jgi:hypothetical protein
MLNQSINEIYIGSFMSLILRCDNNIGLFKALAANRLRLMRRNDDFILSWTALAAWSQFTKIKSA